MKEVLGDIDRWLAAGYRVATARVVGVEGSGPRQPGATMVVSETGEVAGSVSGGCVESAVVTEALASLERGMSPRVCTFGYSDVEAFAVGLTCGGTVRVLVDSSLPAFYDRLRSALVSDEPVATATVVAVEEDAAAGVSVGATMLVNAVGERHGSLGRAELDEVVGRDMVGALASGLSATRRYGPSGEARQRAASVFVEVFAPSPRMVIFGAVDFTAALAKMAKVLGYRVTVCDARPVFTTRARFPMADEIVVEWPHRYLERVGGELSERDAVCVLTHDPKFDVPVHMTALGTDAGYGGAMGSRRTHAEREARLRQVGVDEVGLARIMGPIGLDIGARTPEETAVSICAEIIALRSGRPAHSLRDLQGPIHSSPAPAWA